MLWALHNDLIRKRNSVSGSCGADIAVSTGDSTMQTKILLKVAQRMLEKGFLAGGGGMGWSGRVRHFFHSHRSHNLFLKTLMIDTEAASLVKYCILDTMRSLPLRRSETRQRDKSGNPSRETLNAPQTRIRP